MPWNADGYVDDRQRRRCWSTARASPPARPPTALRRGDADSHRRSAIYRRRHSLEFSANFSGDRSSTPAWPSSSSRRPSPGPSSARLNGGMLFARTNTGQRRDRHALGAAPLGAFHRYRIDWKADQRRLLHRRRARGTVTTVAVRRPDAAGRRQRLQPLRRHHLRRLDAAVAVRRRRARSSRASSTPTRRRLEEHSVDGATRPPAPRLGISVRTGNTPTPDGSWTALDRRRRSGAAAICRRSYIQYRADMTSTDSARDARARGHHHQRPATRRSR